MGELKVFGLKEEIIRLLQSEQENNLSFSLSFLDIQKIEDVNFGFLNGIHRQAWTANRRKNQACLISLHKTPFSLKNAIYCMQNIHRNGFILSPVISHPAMDTNNKPIEPK